MLPSEVTQLVQFVQFVSDHKSRERSYLEARTPCSLRTKIAQIAQKAQTNFLSVGAV